MTEKVGDEGYAFANVTPMFKRHIESKKVDITFDVEKGKMVYIERIEISGNHKTEDRVIRRQLRQMEGARYSASRMKLNKLRMQRTDLFDDIRTSLPRGSEDDKVIMKIEVDEKRTGTFSIGGGFSQLEKLFMTAKVEERNFLGKGLTTNLSVDLGGKTQNFNLSVTEPFFLGEELSVSFNAFKTQTRLQDITSFKQDSWGGGIGFGIPLADFLSYSIRYQYSQTDIFDLPDTASSLLRSQEGKQTTGELTQVLRWDSTNRRLTPTAGQVYEARFGVAGLGGSNRFIEAQLKSRLYFPLGGDFVFSPGVAGKYIHAYSGRKVPIYRRYSLGGIGSIRGFESFGVTIRDQDGQIRGGDKVVTASLELFFPLPFMDTDNFRGVVFADAATVVDSGTPTLSDVRVSSGLGLQWITPVMPVALVWGFPLRSLPDDVESSFEFALGATF
ncbi:MAG: outer membrane protein assembly factor BamA, partial [Mariprofundaceae bacterium]